MPALDPATGDISLPANVPAGTYRIVHEVCQRGADWNCETATSTIIVTAGVQADEDEVADVDGAAGAQDVLNVLDGDTIGASPATTSTVRLRVVTPASAIDGGNVPVLNTSDGLVDVPAQTPAGGYAIVYEICDIANPANCAAATASITVRSANLVAAPDSATSTGAAAGDADVLNVLAGDTVNGNPATVDTVTITLAASGTLPAQLSFDAATGSVSVNPGAEAGTYSFDYQICETLNPANCITASATIVVAPPLAFSGTNATSGGNPAYEFTYEENRSAGASLGSVAATGGQGSYVFAISSGNSESFYAINSATGEISLTAAGAASDANNFDIGPSSRTITVVVTDGSGATRSIPVILNESDIDDAGPVIGDGSGALAVAVDEGTVAAATLTASEPVTWRITGGPDAADFAIDPATGAITFVAAPDFELPADSDANNVYTVIVTATDALGNTSAQTVTVTVRDLDDTAPVIEQPGNQAGGNAEYSVLEDVSLVTSFVANEPVSWALVQGGDADQFSIDPATGALSFIAAPDFEAPRDGDGDNVYTLTIAASDGAGNTSELRVLVTVLDVDDAEPIITGPSGGPGSPSSQVTVVEGARPVAAFAADMDVVWEIAGGADAGRFSIDPATGIVQFAMATDFENPLDADRNNQYDLLVRAVDQNGRSATQSVTVFVTDIDEIAMKLAAIGDLLRGDLRTYAMRSLGDMLAFNENLMSGAREDFCQPVAAQDPFAASVNANQTSQDARFEFNQVRQDCARGWRVRMTGGAVLSGLEGDWTTRGFGTAQLEKRVEDNLTLGLGIMGSFADEQLAGFADSAISDYSLQLNGYVQVDVTDTLRAAGFAAFGKAWYDFDLADDGLILNGAMNGTRYALGAMVSGDIALGDLIVTPDAAISWAVEDLGRARLDARFSGEAREDILFPVGTVNSTRLSVPINLRYVLGDQLSSESRLTEFSLSPGLLCEDISVTGSALTCGYQIGGRVTRTSGTRSFAFADYNYEALQELERHIASFGFGYRFGRDANIELSLEGNHGIAARQGSESRALLVLRAIQ
ncbi:MAG: hypothetical protein WBA51_06205 [Erythrobacter sp.]